VYYCPACEPERDPMREILAVRWCFLHPEPSVAGVDDDVVTTCRDVNTGGSEAHGGNCAAIQGLIQKKGAEAR
jgi:hypothetical protein